MRVVGSVKGVCHPFSMGASRKVGVGLREDQPLDRIYALPSSAHWDRLPHTSISVWYGSMRWTHRPPAVDKGASSLGEQSGDRRQCDCAHACDRMHVRSDDQICVHVRVCPH